MFRNQALKYRLGMLIRKDKLSKEEYFEVLNIQKMLASSKV